MSSTDLSRLAWDLASDGFAGHEADVRHAVRSARRAGVSPVLVGILADPHAPVAARFRAFGRIAAAIDAGGARHVALTTHAA